MSIGHCAEIVAAADPDRFRAALAAPPAARARLLPLWALDLEI
ncbi:MAG: phytoene synthase, partial [Gemmobacter sp.]